MTIRPLARTLAAPALLSALAALSLPDVLSPGELEPDELRDAYHECFEAGTESRLAAIWLDNPGKILTTIDADLEHSLSLWEASPDEPDTKAIADLHARALFGARVASAVTETAIFLDYASAFVGWTDDEKRRFRGGQAAYGKAMGALRDQEFADALEAARDCTAAAEPLGDWWGTAMGLSAEGIALGQLGKHEEALTVASRARLIYDQLGLHGSEYGCLRTMVSQLTSLERWPRARATLQTAIELGEQLGDERGVEDLKEQLQAIEGR